VNDDLINTYKQLRRNPHDLWLAVTTLPVTQRMYHDLRECSPTDLNVFYRAVRFLYLNRFSFNGVYRTNLKGEFNVPRGKRTGGFPSVEEFSHAARLLKRAELVTCDFEALLDEADADDLVYLDPPYHSPTRPASGEYGYGVFNKDDITRLISGAKALHSKGARVLISYRTDIPFRGALSNWHFYKVPVRRQVGASLASRHNGHETLIASWALPQARTAS
jgi:DNA adenine methylase